jgi:hypothetical protein
MKPPQERGGFFFQITFRHDLTKCQEGVILITSATLRHYGRNENARA